MLTEEPSNKRGTEVNGTHQETNGHHGVGDVDLSERQRLLEAAGLNDEEAAVREMSTEFFRAVADVQQRLVVSSRYPAMDIWAKMTPQQQALFSIANHTQDKTRAVLAAIANLRHGDEGEDE